MGTTFKIYLPRVVAAVEAPAPMLIRTSQPQVCTLAATMICRLLTFRYS